MKRLVSGSRNIQGLISHERTVETQPSKPLQSGEELFVNASMDF